MYSREVLAGSDQFVNNGEAAVTDSLLGMACMNPNIGLFDYGNVMVRRDYLAMEGIKIISGGASGHEPSHAGFVGKGMLTAAVQGDIFQSPIASDILKTIKELGYGQDFGILVVIRNCMADRLNFGLAIERARSKGIFIKCILVSEESCIVNPLQGRRGLSGIVLVNKIAGGMAEKECTLDEVYKFCQKVQDSMSSVLLSLSSCTSPNVSSCICTKSVRDNEIEFATGLHGEIGLKRIEKVVVKDVCQVIFDELKSVMSLLDSTTPVVVLFNNLSHMTEMEELIIIKEFVTRLQVNAIPISRMYRGRFLTALDMRGFTVTLLKVFDQKILEYLDEPCEAVSWNYIPKDLSAEFQKLVPSKVKSRKFQTNSGPEMTEREANIILLATQFACDALLSCEKQINVFDSESGSGNVGSKIKRGVSTIIGEIKNKTLYFIYPKVFLQTLSNIAEKEVCGAIGVLYSILFEAASNTFRELPENTEITRDTWLKSLCDATEAVESYTKVDFGAGTIYDPLHAAVIKIKEALLGGCDTLEAFGLGVSAAEEASQLTKQCSRKYPDPGAHSVSIWMRAVFEGVKIRCE